MSRKLPRKHGAAFRQIYLHGKTQHEAAAVLGVSQPRLCAMHRESLAMLDGSWYVRDRDGDTNSESFLYGDGSAHHWLDLWERTGAKH